jgi:hypothetical protein
MPRDGGGLRLADFSVTAACAALLLVASASCRSEDALASQSAAPGATAAPTRIGLPARPTAAITATPAAASPSKPGDVSPEPASPSAHDRIGDDWSHLRWIEAPFPGRYTLSRFAFSGGYVAVSDGGLSQLQTWSSNDAISWTPGGMVPWPKGDPWFDALAEGPHDLVAISSGAACVMSTSGQCQVQPITIWTSSNAGASWTEASDVSAFSGGEAMSMAGGPKGFVAGGTWLWWSVDGTKWTKAGGTGLSGLRWIDSIVSFGDGFVAVGHLTSSQKMAAWRSSDGVHWSRLDLPSFTGTGTGQLAVASAGQLVLTLIGAPGHAWVSSDGKAWKRVSEPHDVIWANSSVALALGLDGAGQTVAWTSSDGVSWTAATIDNASDQTPIWPASGWGSIDDTRDIYQAVMGSSGLYCDLGTSQWLLAPATS